MKKVLIQFVLIFIYMSSIEFIAISQNIKNVQNEILVKKKEFFNEKIPLSVDEQKKFWPIYEDYFKRLNYISQQRNSLLDFFTSNEKNLSSDEINDIYKKLMKLQEDEYNLTKEYFEKFKQILPEGKVIKLFIVENEFKKWLLSQALTIRQNKRN